MIGNFNTAINPIKYYKSLSVPAKAGLWFLLCSFVQKGMAAITTPLYTRLLTVAEYGQISVYFSWADMLGIFITFGLSSSVYQKGLVNYENCRAKYTSSMVSLSIVTTVVSFVIYGIGHRFFNTFIGLPTQLIFLIYLSCFSNSVIEFWCQEKRVAYRYKLFAALTLVLCVVRPMASVFLMYLFPKNKVFARIGSDVLILLVVGFVLLWGMLSKGKHFYSKTVWKESIVYIVPLIPHFLSQRILSQSDRIMISNMIGEHQAGIYSLAYQIGMLLNLLMGAIDSTVAPWAFRKLKEKKYRDVGKLSESMLVLFALCVISFSLIAPEILKIFAPEQYHEAVYIIPVIAVSSYFMFLYMQFIYFEYYSGKTKYVMMSTVFSATLNLTLNYFCIQEFGYVAAAYTTLFCYILYALGHYLAMNYICKKVFSTSKVFVIKSILVVSGAVIMAGFVTIVLYRFYFLRLIIGFICIAVTLYYALKLMKQIGVAKKE